MPERRDDDQSQVGESGKGFDTCLNFSNFCSCLAAMAGYYLFDVLQIRWHSR